MVIFACESDSFLSNLVYLHDNQRMTETRVFIHRLAKHSFIYVLDQPFVVVVVVVFLHGDPVVIPAMLGQYFHHFETFATSVFNESTL